MPVPGRPYEDTFTEYTSVVLPFGLSSTVGLASPELNAGCSVEKTKRPPGFRSREAAATIGSIDSMSMIAMLLTTASNEDGSPSARSACTSVASADRYSTSLLWDRARSSISSLKSVASTCPPRSAIRRANSPLPHAISKTRSPGWSWSRRSTGGWIRCRCQVAPASMRSSQNSASWSHADLTSSCRSRSSLTSPSVASSGPGQKLCGKRRREVALHSCLLAPLTEFVFWRRCTRRGCAPPALSHKPGLDDRCRWDVSDS